MKGPMFDDLHTVPPIPKIGVLILGRKRPGFDPEWGREVAEAIRRSVREERLEAVVPGGNIADDAALRSALAQCAGEGARILVVTQPTISDGRFASTIAHLWKGPLVFWATTERQTGEMISANSLVGTHVFCATLRQQHVPFEMVYGHPDDRACRSELIRALRVASAVEAIATAKVGLAGTHAPGFIDFAADPVTLRDRLGTQLFHLSLHELIDLYGAVPEEEVTRELAWFAALSLPYRHDLSAQTLEVQARFFRTVDRLMRDESLSAFAFRCWPELPNLIGQWPYVALSRFMTEGRAVVMEGDVDGAIGALAAEAIGAGPVYTSDWLEHDRGHIAIWHTGALPLQLCEPAGPTSPHIAVQFNNQKPAVIEATVRANIEGTLFRLWRTDGCYHLTALEGKTVAPRRHLLGTNGLFAAESVDVHSWFDDMVHAGMPHHVHFVNGRHRETLRRLARMLDITWHSA